jgi:hypothetical protein
LAGTGWGPVPDADGLVAFLPGHHAPTAWADVVLTRDWDGFVVWAAARACPAPGRAQRVTACRCRHDQPRPSRGPSATGGAGLTGRPPAGHPPATRPRPAVGDQPRLPDPGPWVLWYRTWSPCTPTPDRRPRQRCGAANPRRREPRRHRYRQIRGQLNPTRPTRSPSLNAASPLTIPPRRAGRHHTRPLCEENLAVLAVFTPTTICPLPAPPAMGIDDAHAAMREHLRCPTPTCRTRREALSVLVGAGQVVLANTRLRPAS